jgi:hypothetical protein
MAICAVKLSSLLLTRTEQAMLAYGFMMAFWICS